MTNRNRKYCYHCKKEKSLKEFYKHGGRPDGLAAACKQCSKDCNKKYNQTTKGKESMQKRVTKYRKTEKGRIVHKKLQKEYWQKHPEKRKVKNALYYAIKTGKIERSDRCSNCGIKCKPDGHHSDYNRPLEVIWLCKECHINLHRKVA